MSTVGFAACAFTRLTRELIASNSSYIHEQITPDFIPVRVLLHTVFDTFGLFSSRETIKSGVGLGLGSPSLRPLAIYSCETLWNRVWLDKINSCVTMWLAALKICKTSTDAPHACRPYGKQWTSDLIVSCREGHLNVLLRTKLQEQWNIQ